MTKNKKPLLHISKRGAMLWYQAWGVRAIAIIAALILCGLITTMTTGLNPIKVYATMIAGNFGTSRKIWIFLQNTAILLGISLAVTPAFKMRFWNIGAEGQVMMGCLGCATIMIVFGESVPNGVLILLSLIAAVVLGAVWALIPALCKAKWNTNETLFTLMMNYVATQLVSFFTIIWENPRGSGQIGIINQAARNGWLPRLMGSEYLLNILVISLITIFVYIYLTYTKHGYELTVVGESERTAKYVGIKVSRVIIRTMLLSGAICGLVGFLLVAGTNHTLTATLAGGRGFTAVMVSWLAKFNPFTMIATSGLLTFLGKGASEISVVYSLNESFADIISGIIIFFIIGSEFFINYKVTLARHTENKPVIKNEIKEEKTEKEKA